jgi:hypothetical protein
MLCCWIEKSNSDAFKRHLARVADFLWIGEDGMKVRVIKNITLGSLFLQALSPCVLIFMCRLLYKGLCWSAMGCCFRSPSNTSM